MEVEYEVHVKVFKSWFSWQVFNGNSAEKQARKYIALCRYTLREVGMKNVRAYKLVKVTREVVG